jgi:hypothetical protein
MPNSVDVVALPAEHCRFEWLPIARTCSFNLARTDSAHAEEGMGKGMERNGDKEWGQPDLRDLFAGMGDSLTCVIYLP